MARRPSDETRPTIALHDLLATVPPRDDVVAATDRECPKCGAQPGEPCRETAFVGTTHWARLHKPGAVEKRDWIVLGNREHGISYGPFTESEAKQFEGGKRGLFALSIENARRDMYTRLAYGL